MRIAVVGAGGVGGYFGGRLAAAGADVHFLARGAHLDAMRAKGLRIESPKGNAHVARVSATDDPAAVGPCDVVLFTVKLYDVEAAIGLLPPLLAADTVVIPLQNGVDTVGLLQRSIGGAHTAGGTTYVTSVIAEPGIVRHTVMDSLIFGELDGTRSARLQRFADACAPAGFHATLSDHITIDIWTKFVRLSTFSGMTAVTRSPIGPIAADPELFSMLKDAAREAAAVARAKGIAVPATTIDDIDRSYVNLPPHMKSSMLEDLERGRRLELPWLSGAVVRIGREVGVDTPTHAFITKALKLHVNGRQA